MISTTTAACLILLQVYFVWLAAQHRKSWPRWALAAALAVISLVEVIGGEQIQLSSAIEMMSCALTWRGCISRSRATRRLVQGLKSCLSFRTGRGPKDH
jgi:hypothetical protein